MSSDFGIRFTDVWPQTDWDQFEIGYSRYRKDFHLIQQRHVLQQKSLTNLMFFDSSFFPSFSFSVSLSFFLLSFSLSLSFFLSFFLSQLSHRSLMEVTRHYFIWRGSRRYREWWEKERENMAFYDWPTIHNPYTFFGFEETSSASSTL